MQVFWQCNIQYMRKISGKNSQPNLVGGPRSFRFLNKRHVFGKEKIFAKNYSPVFFSAEDIHTT